MNLWKKHIVLGNQYFDKNNHALAKKQYRLAIARSRQLFSSWLNPDEAVCSLLVSYQNLAELYEKQGYPRRALLLLEELDHILREGVDAAEQSLTTDQERLFAIQNGLRCSYTHLLYLQKKMSAKKRTANARA